MMNASDFEKLSEWIAQLANLQESVEELLSRQTAWKKTLRRQDPEFEQADLICDSLGYVIDDLDSILENLDELQSLQ